MDDSSRPSSELEELVADALGRIEAGGPSELERICAEHPDQARHLRERVEWLLGTGLARPEQEPRFRHPERLGDFQLFESIGQGGMGVVYRAQQVSLKREVALKLVRPEQLFFAGARERFQREVTTVAGLAHPGIVPVYGVGEAEGVPYFAMELVRGATLADVISKLVGRDPRTLTGADFVAALDACGADEREAASPLFEGSWPTVCTRIAREVAEALEHAHRRGVLHRDVKPSNVMVTRGGRVMLVDFGLSSSGTAEDRETRTGAQVGTLAYMPPEQLRGERELDARADVFALGVTLFELLTFGLPFRGSPLERAAQDGGAPIPSLRKLDPRVPWELETVVQTACEQEPGRRYGTAEDLASDLGRVLDGRPIEARRSSVWLRARRWVQRHPAVSLALAVVVLGPSLFAWQQLRSKRVVTAKNAEVAEANAKLGQANSALEDSLEETGRQRDAADEARQRAERAFDRAFDSIELMLGRVGGELLEDVPGVEPIRRGLLEDALRLHAELLEEPIVDARQLALHAATLRRSAAIQAELGDYEQALAAFDTEAPLLDELLAAAPSADLERQRGLLDYRRAQVLKLLGEFDSAELAAREAVDRLEDALRRRPGVDDLTRSLARARMELADVLTRMGRIEERKPVLDEALAALMGTDPRERGSRRERRELGNILHLLGVPPSIVATKPGDLSLSEEAERAMELAVETRRALVQERPEDPSARRELGESLLALGVYPGLVADYERAHAHLAEANALYTRLNAEYPARPVYLDGVAASSLNLSQMCAFLERHDERVAWLERAVRGFEELLERVPASVEYRRNLGVTLAQMGQVLADSEEHRDLPRAIELFERSIELNRPLATGPRADPGVRYALGWAHSQLVLAHAQTGSAANVVRAARKLLEFEATPVDHVYVAQHLGLALGLAREPGSGVELASMLDWEDEAFELLERAIELAPDDPEVRREIVDPRLLPLEGDPRYQGLLEYLGMRH